MKGTKFSPETWKTIQALYQSGQYASTRELQKNCKKIFNGAPVPSVSAIEKRVCAERWDKHASDDIISQRKEQSFRDLFSRLGMDEKRRAEIIVQGINSAQDIRKRIVDMVDEIPKHMAAKGKEVPAFLGGLEAIVKQLEPLFSNMSMTRQYMDMALKLSGDYAPEKKTVRIRDSRPQSDLDAMTDEELETQLQRMNKAKRKHG